MPFAQGSRHDIATVPEVTFGVTPGGPTMTLMRNTGTTLGLSKETFLSGEVRSDRQITISRHGNKQIGGDVNFELSYGALDAYIESMMFSTFSDVTGTGSGATTDASGYAIGVTGPIALASAGTGTILVGDVITFAGDTNPYMVLLGDTDVSDGGNITLQAPGLLVAIPAAPTAITVRAGDQIKVGIIQKSFSIERRFNDISQFLVYAGCVANTFSLSIAPGQMITGTMGFIGSKLTVDTSELAVPGAAPSNEPFSAFEGSLLDGDSVIAIVTAMTMNMNNGVEANFVLGSDVTPQLSFGRANLTGTLTAFFEDAVLLNKFINETPASLKLTLKDAALNILDFDIPNIRYNGGNIPANTEQSLQIELPWQAILDSTTVTNLLITRNPV